MLKKNFSFFMSLRSPDFIQYKNIFSDFFLYSILYETRPEKPH